MIGSFFLVVRLAFAWYLVVLVLVVTADWLWPPLGNAALLAGAMTRRVVRHEPAIMLRRE